MPIASGAIELREGIVSKRLGSGYVSGRSRDWLKAKNPNSPAVTREAEEDWSAATLVLVTAMSPASCLVFSIKIDRQELPEAAPP